MRSIDKPGGLVHGLLDDIDSILGIRDDLGVALYDVFIVTRTWTGSENGEGTAKEEKAAVTPSPRILDMSDDSRIVPGGAVQLDDLMLRGISKNAYRNKVDVDCTSALQNIEKFFEVGGLLYSVVKVQEKQLTWNVQIRKLSNQKRYEPVAITTEDGETLTTEDGEELIL